ncbi:hypothetical protein PIB30_003545 [Stylosanthes scabra]|uniref:Uncharacterized protein n=1 Tax=Stylosanthes scabra TaxID=79078 RepID=A0ABU6X468_9FABA|nr:hypothetical protein [Stylosanthes scabra]
MRSLQFHMPVEVKIMLGEQVIWKKLQSICLRIKSVLPSKVLVDPNDAIGKIYGPEDGKRVRGFSSVVCLVGFGKSKRIFEVASCGSSSNVSQQHVEDLERQLKQTKDQVATLQISISKIWR